MANLTSTQSGNWSSTSTWGGVAPSSTSNIIIAAGHTITLDVNSTIDGITINDTGILKFATGLTLTLTSTKNIVVNGRFEIKPANASIIHTVRFTGINENNFVGGGMDVLATDIGIWVMGGVMGELTGGGEVDILGTTKTTFLNATSSLVAGATSITLASAPVGWEVGDPIVITPTESPTVGSAYITNFEERTITSISGSTITINTGLTRGHPKVNNLWTAEVINLIRNVRIEGTSTGKSHLFIRSNGTQSIKNVQFRYMGPRKDRTGDSTKEFVSGRYACHFHHCMVGSIGSIVDGCVARDCDSHCYVPHVSDGIMMSNNATYNTTEIAFWWDPGEESNDNTFDHNIVALCKYQPGAANQNAEDAPTFSSNGFLFSRGDNNTAKNNVVCGNYGDPADGGAFNWEATIIEGVWTFVDNLAHNNECGLRVWQNSTRNHIIKNFISYNNGIGVFHGAYANSYTYDGGIIFANTFQIKAASVNSNRVRIQNLTIDGNNEIPICLEVIESPLDGEVPIIVRNVTIKNYTSRGISDESPEFYKHIDVVQSTVLGSTPYVVDASATATEEIRVQPTSGSVLSVKKSGTTTIAAFAPTSWGIGTGLKGEYFYNTNFTSPAFTRVDSVVAFQEWSSGVHHLLTSNSYSVRWTGQIQAQFSQSTTFVLGSGGGHKLWVNNTVLLDGSSEDNYPDAYTSSPITLVAGTKYDIKIEYWNSDANSGMNLYWQSASMPLSYVPQSQLYPPDDIVTNQPPLANAGSDQSIILPTNSTNLIGTGSTDDNGIVNYSWTRVSGPNTPTLTNANTATATISGLIAGTYIYRLTVTDGGGLTGTDTVQITVTTSNQPPVARAGADFSITLPTDVADLDGSGSTDGDGTISSYLWTKQTGPSSYMLMNETTAHAMAHNLTQGDYVFRLTVTDNLGATSNDDIMVSVLPAAGANQPPVVTVGSTVLVILPTNSATISGTSSDADGTIVSNRWTRISGPNTPTIVNPNNLSTNVTGLIAGVYTFRLTATDNKGAATSKDQLVVVSPASGVTIQGRYHIIIQ